MGAFSSIPILEQLWTSLFRGIRFARGGGVRHTPHAETKPPCRLELLGAGV